MCDKERVCEDSSYWRLKRFSRVSRDLASHEVMHVPCTWLEYENSVQMETVVSHEYLTGEAFPRDILFCQSVLSDTHFLYPHYIYPHYSQMLRNASERKPYPNTLKVRDYHTHISLHICLWISSTPTSPFPHHWEVDSSNTYHSLSECQMRFWCC